LRLGSTAQICAWLNDLVLLGYNELSPGHIDDLRRRIGLTGKSREAACVMTPRIQRCDGVLHVAIKANLTFASRPLFVFAKRRAAFAVTLPDRLIDSPVRRLDDRPEKVGNDTNAIERTIG
jgi:hypothetical protein